MADQCERTAKAATDPAAQYVYRSFSGGRRRRRLRHLSGDLPRNEKTLSCAGQSS